MVMVLAMQLLTLAGSARGFVEVIFLAVVQAAAWDEAEPGLCIGCK